MNLTNDMIGPVYVFGIPIIGILIGYLCLYGLKKLGEKAKTK
jgi:hypothetical protein